MKVGIKVVPMDGSPDAGDVKIFTTKPDEYSDQYDFDIFEANVLRADAEDNRPVPRYVYFEVDKTGVVPESVMIFSEKSGKAAKAHRENRMGFLLVRFSNAMELVAKLLKTTPRQLPKVLYDEQKKTIFQVIEENNLKPKSSRVQHLIEINNY